MAERINRLCGFVDLAGKAVLEIGADWQGVASSLLLKAGAAEIFSSNMTSAWPANRRDGKVTKVRADARELARVFGEHQFDVIFGVAILEHIIGLDAFLEEVAKVLKPGGFLYVHGGPLWSFAKGHHVWVTNGGRHYRFSDTTNPIGRWRHLVNDFNSLQIELVAGGLPEDDAQLISQFVYNSAEVNRVGYKDMKASFANSSLETVDIMEAAFSGPPREIADAIERGPYGGQLRYHVSGLTFAMRQPLR